MTLHKKVLSKGILLFALASSCFEIGCAGLGRYSGQWVLQSSGKNMMILTTKVHHRHLEGTLIAPTHFSENADGSFTGITQPFRTLRVVGRRKKGVVVLLTGAKPDRDIQHMQLVDSEHARVSWTHSQVPDWRFYRVPLGKTLYIGDDWPPEEVNH